MTGSKSQVFETEAAVVVLDQGVLELFRTGKFGGASSERWLIRLLQVEAKVAKSGAVEVGWRRPPGGEEGTLTLPEEQAAEGHRLLDVLLEEGATRKE